MCTNSPDPQLTLIPPSSPPSSHVLSHAAITVHLLDSEDISQEVVAALSLPHKGWMVSVLHGWGGELLSESVWICVNSRVYVCLLMCTYVHQVYSSPTPVMSSPSN